MTDEGSRRTAPAMLLVALAFLAVTFALPPEPALAAQPHERPFATAIADFGGSGNGGAINLDKEPGWSAALVADRKSLATRFREWSRGPFSRVPTQEIITPEDNEGEDQASGSDGSEIVYTESGEPEADNEAEGSESGQSEQEGNDEEEALNGEEDEPTANGKQKESAASGGVEASDEGQGDKDKPATNDGEGESAAGDGEEASDEEQAKPVVDDEVEAGAAITREQPYALIAVLVILCVIGAAALALNEARRSSRR